MTDNDLSRRRRSRLQLLLVVAMFLGSFAVAAALFFGGWTPTQTRNFGRMLDPYPSLQDVALTRHDGTPWQWQPAERHWHILVPAPDAQACDGRCASLLDALHRVWYSEGRHAERLHVLWLGELPATAPAFSGLVALQPQPQVTARLPERASPAGVPVYLVDGNGYVVLHYAAGFDPVQLRKDLGRLLK